MKAAKGHTKEDYRNAPNILEFGTIEHAGKYLADKYNQSIECMIERIKDDTNCDAIYFEDGNVILYEL